MALLPSSLWRCWPLLLQHLLMNAPFHPLGPLGLIHSLSSLRSPHKSSLLHATLKLSVPLKDMYLPRVYFCISFFHTLFAVQRNAYLTQVAMHYPHLHRPDGAGVAYGHYEEPPRQLRDSRLPIDMQGRTHPISGYRLVHWSPDLKPGLANNHMEQSSRDSVLTVAAVLSFFTARSVHLDNESSKLLLLTPHNDTVL